MSSYFKGWLAGMALLVLASAIYLAGKPSAPPFPALDPSALYPARPVGLLTLLPETAATLAAPNGDTYVLYYHAGALHIWVNDDYAGRVNSALFLTLDAARETSPDDVPLWRFKHLGVVFITLDQNGLLIAGLVFDPELFAPIAMSHGEAPRGIR